VNVSGTKVELCLSPDKRFKMVLPTYTRYL